MGFLFYIFIGLRTTFRSFQDFFFFLKKTTQKFLPFHKQFSRTEPICKNIKCIVGDVLSVLSRPTLLYPWPNSSFDSVIFKFLIKIHQLSTRYWLVSAQFWVMPEINKLTVLNEECLPPVLTVACSCYNLVTQCAGGIKRCRTFDEKKEKTIENSFDFHIIS